MLMAATNAQRPKAANDQTARTAFGALLPADGWPGCGAVFVGIT
jgi:hypothetical protein